MAADRFEYAASTKVAHYRQSALLRTGKDEIRADEIRIQELAGGKRRLEAAGSVVSRMHPAAEKGAAKPAALVEARAKEMTYEEGKNEIVYTGDVVIRQGDIQTTSPKATLKLADGRQLHRHPGGRRAGGGPAGRAPCDRGARDLHSPDGDDAAGGGEGGAEGPDAGARRAAR